MSRYIVEMDDDRRCSYCFANRHGYICIRSDKWDRSCEGDLKNRPEWCDLEKFVAYPTKIDNNPFVIGEKK